MGSWDDVTSYEQLQDLTPAEREAHFDSCIVWDPADLPEAYRKRREAQSARVLAREERLRGQAS
ncbi:MAG TPA: hypothetical protein VI248_00920 [Kineosporiaceae bacterium]